MQPAVEQIVRFTFEQGDGREMVVSGEYVPAEAGSWAAGHSQRNVRIHGACVRLNEVIDAPISVRAQETELAERSLAAERRNLTGGLPLRVLPLSEVVSVMRS